MLFHPIPLQQGAFPGALKARVAGVQAAGFELLCGPAINLSAARQPPWCARSLCSPYSKHRAGAEWALCLLAAGQSQSVVDVVAALPAASGQSRYQTGRRRSATPPANFGCCDRRSAHRFASDKLLCTKCKESPTGAYSGTAPPLAASWCTHRHCGTVSGGLSCAEAADLSGRTCSAPAGSPGDGLRSALTGPMQISEGGSLCGCAVRCSQVFV
jgi:hypothetical protein